MHISSYFNELRFAMRATSDWRSRASLLAATFNFHLNNFAKVKRRGHTPIQLDLRIGQKTRTVTVRPFSGDIFILYEILASETYKVAETLIDPTSVRTIVDCGANIGMTSLYFAERYPNARIISVEPDPANLALLRRNTQSEPRIVPVWAALVGSRRGPVVLTQDRPAWGNQIADAVAGGGGIEVPSLTMVDLCSSNGLTQIDLLKVDIEGAEEELFAEPSFLRVVRFVTIELHDDYTIDRFRHDVASMGFEVRLPGAADGARTVTAFPAN